MLFLPYNIYNTYYSSFYYIFFGPPQWRLSSLNNQLHLILPIYPSKDNIRYRCVCNSFHIASCTWSFYTSQVIDFCSSDFVHWSIDAYYPIMHILLTREYIPCLMYRCTPELWSFLLYLYITYGLSPNYIKPP